MIQATTPTVILTLPNTVDLSTAQEVYVSFRQRSALAANNVLTKTLGPSVWLADGHTINVYLTQTETLGFIPSRAIEVQVNWITNGTREATLIAYLNISNNLIPEVIET